MCFAGYKRTKNEQIRGKSVHLMVCYQSESRPSLFMMRLIALEKNFSFALDNPCYLLQIIAKVAFQNANWSKSVFSVRVQEFRQGYDSVFLSKPYLEKKFVKRRMKIL